MYIVQPISGGGMDYGTDDLVSLRARHLFKAWVCAAS